MYAKVISPRELDLYIWERGSGVTWACGTGAVSTVKAGIQRLSGGRNQGEYARRQREREPNSR